VTLESTQLADGRRLTIYLPPGYDPSAPAPYPLLVMHDGQNLFDPERAYVKGQHWRVGETLDELIGDKTMTPIVVAGIDHAGMNRINEMTPTPGQRPGAGGAAAYGRLVVHDVLPFLRATYHVRRDAAGTALGGSSLGGLVTLVIAMAHPRVFGQLIVMSPSVWWDRKVILRKIRATELDGWIWLDVGLKEGGRTVADARRLRDAIRAAWPGAALTYVEDPEGDHSERAWARRFRQAVMVGQTLSSWSRPPAGEPDETSVG
jgi:enterochelin esterase-like enzyme